MYGKTQAGYTDSSANTQDMLSFERHADGGFIKRSFDIFGNKRSETERINSLTDTNGRTTDYSS